MKDTADPLHGGRVSGSTGRSVFRSAGRRKRYAEQVFQQWRCNNHVLKTDQVIAVGNEVCSIGEWSCTVQDQSGGTIQVHGYYTDVNFREGDTCKIRISTFNLAPPAETK
jgi:hypothetical protein